ncbi:MAG: hypothetical protein BGP25_05365 [Lysobacterales bacterium 63-13]|nr:MAG: hypothetical protein BGP25_05365 [Xanthomonadales bacterium 63-13]
MRVLITIGEGCPLLLDELSMMGSRQRARRLRSLAELGLQIERGRLGVGPLGRTSNAEPLAPTTDKAIRDLVSTFAMDDD